MINEDFQIKDLKTSPGLDLSLYFHGKCVAAVSNHAHGGAHQWQWLDKDAEQAFEQYAKTLPLEFDFEHGDQFLDALVERQRERDWEAAHLAAWKADCRKAQQKTFPSL